MFIQRSKHFAIWLLALSLMATSCSSGPSEPDPKLQQRIDFYLQLSTIARSDIEMKEEYYSQVADAYREAGDEENADKYEAMSYDLLRMDQPANAYAQMVKNRPKLQPQVITLCDSFLAQNPSFAYALYEKGQAYMRMQDFHNAKLYADQALAADPDLWEAQALSEVAAEMQ